MTAKISNKEDLLSILINTDAEKQEAHQRDMEARISRVKENFQEEAPFILNSRGIVPDGYAKFDPSAKVSRTFSGIEFEIIGAQEIHGSIVVQFTIAGIPLLAVEDGQSFEILASLPSKHVHEFYEGQATPEKERDNNVLLPVANTPDFVKICQAEWAEDIYGEMIGQQAMAERGFKSESMGPTIPSHSSDFSENPPYSFPSSNSEESTGPEQIIHSIKELLFTVMSFGEEQSPDEQWEEGESEGFDENEN